jgi:hypothetical protein
LKITRVSPLLDRSIAKYRLGHSQSREDLDDRSCTVAQAQHTTPGLLPKLQTQLLVLTRCAEHASYHLFWCFWGGQPFTRSSPYNFKLGLINISECCCGAVETCRSLNIFSKLVEVLLYIQLRVRASNFVNLNQSCTTSTMRSPKAAVELQHVLRLHITALLYALCASHELTLFVSSDMHARFIFQANGAPTSTQYENRRRSR